MSPKDSDERTSLLDKIDGPADLHGLSDKELQQLAQEVRELIIDTIGEVGALTGGVAFEALHNAGGLDVPIVIVLNDNGMSIAPNVGALSRYFNRIRFQPDLYRAREAVETGLTKIPAGIGERFERLGPQPEESIQAVSA